MVYYRCSGGSLHSIFWNFIVHARTHLLAPTCAAGVGNTQSFTLTSAQSEKQLYFFEQLPVVRQPA